MLSMYSAPFHLEDSGAVGMSCIRQYILPSLTFHQLASIQGTICAPNHVTGNVLQYILYRPVISTGLYQGFSNLFTRYFKAPFLCRCSRFSSHLYCTCLGQILTNFCLLDASHMLLLMYLSHTSFFLKKKLPHNRISIFMLILHP